MNAELVLSVCRGLLVAALLHLSLCLSVCLLYPPMPISATSFLIIMTWLVAEVLMVLSEERGVGVEERVGEGGGEAGE